MSVSLAGSMGGLHGLKYSDKTTIKKLFLNRLSCEEFQTWNLKHHNLRIASIVTNNACNLRCKHCYLKVEGNKHKEMTIAEWKKVISSIAQLKPGLISISGKEIFVDPKGTELLLYLREIKDRNCDAFRIGFITNGILLHEYFEPVLKMNPDYLDISLDGMQNDHDKIRGKGAYSKVLPNLKWAIQNFRERFFINLTIQRINASHIIETIFHFQDLGVSNISTVFFKPQPYTDSNLILSTSQIKKILLDLHKLSNIVISAPLKLILDIDISHLPSTLVFLNSDWFNIDSIEEDETNSLYIQHQFNNGLSLWFRLHIIPSGITRSRLTPEGNFLAAGDTLNTERYPECTIGNIRNFNYDFPLLFDFALKSRRFNEIYRDFYYKTLPLLISMIRTNPLREKNYVKQVA